MKKELAETRKLQDLESKEVAVTGRGISPGSKKSYRLYDKTTKTWFEVSPEQYAEIDRWRTNLRKKEQYHHRCRCPRNQFWLCDGMCQDCKFRCAGDTISLDAAFSDEEGDGGSLLDLLEASGPRMEDQYADRDLIDRLFKKLRELDPDAEKIIAMWEEDYRVSDRGIARALGRAQRTFADQMKRYRSELKKIRG